ncbi:MAG: nitrogen regulation protein NR(II) [Myxococcota bacterium]
MPHPDRQSGEGQRMQEEGDLVNEGATKGLGWLLGGRLLLAGLGLALAVALDQIEVSHSESGIRGVYWTVAGAFLATIVSAKMLGRTRDPARFATLHVSIDIGLVTSLVYFSGGGDSVFTFLYALVVLYGALFLDRVGVGFSTGLAALGYGFVLFGSELGLLPAAGPHETSRPLLVLGAYWGFYASSLLILGMLANTLSAELRRTGAALDRRTHDLRRLRDLHLRTVESIGSGLVTLDEDYRVTSFNPEAERITGIDADAAQGQLFNALIPGAQLDDIASGTGTEPTQAKSPSDRDRDRLVYRKASGEELYLGLATSRLRGESGRPMGHVVIFQDVTQVVSMEQELRQSERLAAVGEMAARMAHEIRNPLASISGSVQVLQSGMTESDAGDPEHGKLMGIVVREVDRLNVLISDFLRYSRPAPIDLEPVDLGLLVREIAEMQSLQSGTSIEMQLDLASDAVVMADASQIKAVVWNLLNNALEALPNAGKGEGEIFARVSLVPGDPTQGEVLPNRYAEEGRAPEIPEKAAAALIEIEDTGPGIPAEDQEMIFEPFFTTKRDGTGLGLATVQRIVEQHGGAIKAMSRPGQGTCFRVSLPCVAETP